MRTTSQAIFRFDDTRKEYPPPGLLTWQAGSFLLGRGTQRGEDGIRSKIRGKFTDVGFHGRMPMVVKTEYVHLFNGLLHRPMIFRDAIGGNHHAGAVAAIPAMDENLLSLRVMDEGKKLGDLLVRWGRPAADRNVDESKAERFRTFALQNDV